MKTKTSKLFIVLLTVVLLCAMITPKAVCTSKKCSAVTYSDQYYYA